MVLKLWQTTAQPIGSVTILTSKSLIERAFVCVPLYLCANVHGMCVRAKTGLFDSTIIDNEINTRILMNST